MILVSESWRLPFLPESVDTPRKDARSGGCTSVLWVLFSCSTLTVGQQESYLLHSRPRLPRVAPMQSSLAPYPFTFPHSTLYFSIFHFSLSYSFYIFSCFSIPSHSIRIVPLRFQAGCHRRRLNLALSFLLILFYTYFLVKDAMHAHFLSN